MSRPRARLRLVCGLGIAALGALLGAGPALAAPAFAAPALAAPSLAAPALAASANPSGPAPSASPASPAPSVPAPSDAAALTPLVDCVQDAPLGVVTSRTVVLGYRSTASAAVAVAPGGGANDLTAGAADRGQPASFSPGEHHGVWLLTVDAAAEPALAWRLGASDARFDSAPACTAATVVTLSVPAQAAAGGTAAVSAAVGRMLLAAPDTGTVVFSLDGGQGIAAAVSPTGVAHADLPIPAAGPHTVTAAYRPAEGSGLQPSIGTAALTATAASAPLHLAADSVVTGSTSVLVTVSRPTAAGAATVELVTADGSARAGTDYTAVSTTVTLADGRSSVSLRIPLASRAAGAPAAAFFVLLQRSTAPVAAASATIALPAVPAVPAAASASGSDQRPAALAAASSALPPDDPTAAEPVTAIGSAQDLAMMVGGILLTAGGILGVFGLLRAAGMRGARA